MLPVRVLTIAVLAALQCSSHAYTMHSGLRGSSARQTTQSRVAMSAVVSPCVIKVVGVGGGGGNAINRMIQFGQADKEAVEYWAINTDIQALDASLSPNRLGLGAGTSRGLGAGGNPEMGGASAEESYDQITQMVSDSDMVFVVAGMGGGTGTGAAPVVAQAARAAGCLTVGVVTKPFMFEGQRRMRQAEAGIAKLKQQVRPHPPPPGRHPNPTHRLEIQTSHFPYFVGVTLRTTGTWKSPSLPSQRTTA